MISQRKYLDKLNLKLYVCNKAIALMPLTAISFPLSANAQIIPDNTLGAESSVVTPIEVPSRGRGGGRGSREVLIEGGAIRDSNLFHSFQEFNINRGQRVNFSNPESISNIFSRVTGNNASEIFGRLGVNGDANLFLINPNGIVFGEGSNIDLNGAFFATTADSVVFADGSSFSAVNPEAPPLLTVSIPIGLQLGNNSQPIQAQQATITAQNITLIGGEIELQQTTLTAPGGEINLGSFGEGSVSFADIAANTNRQDIKISDRSLISTIADGEGNVNIYANSLTIEDSEIAVGIAEGQGNPDVVGGNVTFNATEDIYIGNSNLNNDVEANSQGNAGKIGITAQNLTLENSRISSETNSTGNAGDVEVTVSNRLTSISNPPETSDSAAPPHLPGSNPDPTGEPLGDNQQTRNSLPPGNGNNPARNNPPPTGSNVPLDRGNNPPPTESNSSPTPPSDGSQNPISARKGLFSRVSNLGSGDGGNISIAAQEVTLSGLGGISASTVGEGDGGTVTVNSDRIIVNKGAGIFANTGGTGNSGAITLEANSTLLDDSENSSTNHRGILLPGGIIADVRSGSVGNGGNITIETNTLKVIGGALVTTDTKGSGNGGDISINASESVTVSNTGDRTSQIVSGVRPTAPGRGGDINITTGNLFLLHGGAIDAETAGITDNADAGNISILATGTVQLSGVSRDGLPSQILAQVGRGDGENPVTGTGGDIYLQANNLWIRDGGQISASTLSLGEGGSVTVEVTEETSIAGTATGFSPENRRTPNFIGSRDSIPSGIFASSPGEGDANALNLTTNSLSVREQGQISVSSQMQGAAGNLTIQAATIEVENGVFSAETVQGNDANIFLYSEDIRLQNQGRITTNATGTATGGNITIDTKTLLAIENSDITANAQDSFGGQVTINAEGVFGAQVRDRPSPESDITASSRLGTQFNGVVQLNTPDADPVSGLTELPENFRDASNQIVAGCSLDKNNSFVVTGRGGLPDSPGELISGQSILQDWRIVEDTENISLEIKDLPVSQTKSAIVEAQQLVISKGNIELVAKTNNSQDFWLRGMGCSSLS